MDMRDEIDEEVRKLLEDMERNCDMSAVLNGAEDSVAQALLNIGELHERARQGVREAICALATHYDSGVSQGCNDSGRVRHDLDARLSTYHTSRNRKVRPQHGTPRDALSAYAYSL